MDNQKESKNIFQATTFHADENSRTFQDCANPEPALSLQLFKAAPTPPPPPFPLGRPALIQLSEPDGNKAHSTQKRSTLAGNHPWRGSVTP